MSTQIKRTWQSDLARIADLVSNDVESCSPGTYHLQIIDGTRWRTILNIGGVWLTCWEQAWQAYCAGSIPIGAAIADREGRILSAGANRFFDGSSRNENQICGSRLAHAEVNAILGVDFSQVRACDCVLYTTVEPCPLCVGATAMAGIKELHFASRDPWAGSTNLLDATPYLRGKRIHVQGPSCAVLELASVALNTDFMLRKDRARFEKVVRAWDATCPETASRAVGIFESGILPELSEAGATSSEVLTELQDRITAIAD